MKKFLFLPLSVFIFLAFVAVFAPASFAENTPEVRCQNHHCGLFKNSSSDKLLLPLMDEITEVQVRYPQRLYDAEENSKKNSKKQRWDSVKYSGNFYIAKKDGKSQIYLFDANSDYITKYDGKKNNKKPELLTQDEYENAYALRYNAFFVKKDGTWNLFSAKTKSYYPLDIDIVAQAPNNKEYFIVKQDVDSAEKLGVVSVSYLENKEADVEHYLENGVTPEQLKISPMLDVKYDEIKFSYHHRREQNLITKTGSDYELYSVYSNGEKIRVEKPFDMKFKKIEEAKVNRNLFRDRAYLATIQRDDNDRTIFISFIANSYKEKFGIIEDGYENFLLDENKPKSSEFKKGKRIKENGKYGFIDKKGRVRLEPVYDKIYPILKYPTNYMIVKKDGKFAIYKISSNKLTDFKYDMAYISANTPIIAFDGDNKDVFDKKGYFRLIKPAIYRGLEKVVRIPANVILSIGTGVAENILPKTMGTIVGFRLFANVVNFLPDLLLEKGTALPVFPNYPNNYPD